MMKCYWDDYGITRKSLAAIKYYLDIGDEVRVATVTPYDYCAKEIAESLAQGLLDRQPGWRKYFLPETPCTLIDCEATGYPKQDRRATYSWAELIPGGIDQLADKLFNGDA